MSFRTEQYAVIDEKNTLIIDDIKFKDNLSVLTPGDYVVTFERIRTEKTEEEWQKHFGKILFDYCMEQGFDRQYREKVIKPMLYEAVLPGVYQNPKHINILYEDIDKLTTKILTPHGWRAFMEGLRLWLWSQSGYLM